MVDVGGIFFDYLWVNDDVFAFVEAAGRRFLDAYLPIVEKRIDTPFTPAQKEWQEILPMLVSDRWQLTRDLALLAGRQLLIKNDNVGPTLNDQIM